jgi:hypothetical protein
MRGPVRTDEGAEDLSSLCALPCGNSGRRRPAAASVASLGALPERRCLAAGDPQALNSGRVSIVESERVLDGGAASAELLRFSARVFELGAGVGVDELASLDPLEASIRSKP